MALYFKRVEENGEKKRAIALIMGARNLSRKARMSLKNIAQNLWSLCILMM